MSVIRKLIYTQLSQSNETFSCTKTLKFNVNGELHKKRKADGTCTSLLSSQNYTIKSISSLEYSFAVAPRLIFNPYN